MITDKKRRIDVSNPKQKQNKYFSWPAPPDTYILLCGRRTEPPLKLHMPTDRRVARTSRIVLVSVFCSMFSGSNCGGVNDNVNVLT